MGGEHPGERGSARGALTVPYIQHNDADISINTVIDALKTAAATITAAIGGRQAS